MCAYVVMGNSPQLDCCIVREPKMPHRCNAMGVLLSCHIIVYTYICAWCSVLGWGGEVAAVMNKSYHVPVSEGILYTYCANSPLQPVVSSKAAILYC